jgi:hypothetical protein
MVSAPLVWRCPQRDFVGLPVDLAEMPPVRVVDHAVEAEERRVDDLPMVLDLPGLWFIAASG